MTPHEIAHPPIVSRDEWLAARVAHLEHEKELTRHHDRVTAERRRLPMVRADSSSAPESVQAMCWQTCWRNSLNGVPLSLFSPSMRVISVNRRPTVARNSVNPGAAPGAVCRATA